MTSEQQIKAKPLHIPQAIVVSELAQLLGVTPVDVIKELMKNGVMATINQVVDFDTAAVVATDLGYAPEEDEPEPAAAADTHQGQPSTSVRVIQEDSAAVPPRAPAVTV